MIGLIAALALGLDLPSLDIPQLPAITRDPQITYVDRNGAVIGIRGGRYAPPEDITRLPAYVPAAFVSIEDRRFYEHAGFDLQGIARAILTDIGAGHATQGASTITQQLARNLFLTSDRTLERKGTELIYAVELEQTYSKQQILGLYLSRVYFGSGAYGIEAAARRYFDKPAAKLTIREAAMLAAIMKSPVEYDPAEQPARSVERTALVLDAMVDTGAITPAQRVAALAEKPHVWTSAPDAPEQYFVDWVDTQVRGMGPPNADIVVETTLDARDEAAAQASISDTVTRFAKANVEQAALVALDPQGRVRALIGGVDHSRSGFNRAIDAHRQAGSSWKPFVYLTALEAGHTPDEMVVDQPVTIDGWSPHDFEPTFLGQITLQTALAQSVNTVAAQLADTVGRPNVAATARRLGIVTQINTDPAMALGSSLVTPIEMAEAYDAFSNGGDRVQAWAIERIRVPAAGDRVIWQHAPPQTPNVIGNPALGELNQMLRQVLVSGTGVGARIPGYDLAGKTGTASDFKDAWFCGFTGGLTTVVWMGRDDDTPMRGITGGSAPAQAWRGFMRVALKHVQATAIPSGPPAPPGLLLVPPPIPTAGPSPPPASVPPADASPPDDGREQKQVLPL